ncbi:MAG: GntR family transcriptional regulator [Clostridiales Family XIII bacterium]|nr:GntR family transcriptional regulator [Clostridiales Family XIII bacterium]
MKSTLDNDRPIFQQIKEMIEEDILSGLLKPDEQIPSNSRLVSYYGINPVTVHKGVTLLADEGLIYKKRGLGMFVAPDAPDILRKSHGAAFQSEYAAPLVRQARALGMSDADIHAHIDEALEEVAEERANGRPAHPKKEEDDSNE